MSSASSITPYSSTLPPNLEKIGRMLAGGHLPSIAKTIFANDDIRKLLLTKFLEAINQECNALCRKSFTFSQYSS